MKYNYSVSIVLPMLDERESIESTVRNAVSFLSNCNPGSEIIIVDDGSIDGSFDIVRKLRQEISLLKCIRFDRNKGIGKALRVGFNQAKNDLILYTDSDWPVNNEVLKQAFYLLISERADLVVGYRRGKRESSCRHMYSFFYNLFVRTIFRLKIKDVNCPLKLFYKKVVNDIVLKSDSPFINVEFLVRSKNKGYKIIELPYSNISRKLGHSKFSSCREIMKAIKGVFREMLKFTLELIFAKGKKTKKPDRRE